MTTQEKALYHQIHPLKLATDISAQLVSGYFFWVHDLFFGLLAMFLPPIVISLIMINTMDFAWIQKSPAGRYLKRSMTRAMEALRLAGTLPISLGFWYHLPWLLVLGLLMVLFGWLRGLVFPPRMKVAG